MDKSVIAEFNENLSEIVVRIPTKSVKTVMYRNLTKLAHASQKQTKETIQEFGKELTNEIAAIFDSIIDDRNSKEDESIVYLPDSVVESLKLAINGNGLNQTVGEKAIQCICENLGLGLYFPEREEIKV